MPNKELIIVGVVLFLVVATLYIYNSTKVLNKLDLAEKKIKTIETQHKELTKNNSEG